MQWITPLVVSFFLVQMWIVRLSGAKVVSAFDSAVLNKCSCASEVSTRRRRQRFRSPVNVEPPCSNVRPVAAPSATVNV
jgi:hypothetical protein